MEEYASIFGYRVISGPFKDAIQRVEVCFLGYESNESLQIELVSPLDPGSPVTRFITKGIATYHTCYDVADIEEALEFVRVRGCFVVAEPVPAVAFDQRRIAWFYTNTKQLVEIVESTAGRPAQSDPQVNSP